MRTIRVKGHTRKGGVRVKGYTRKVSGSAKRKGLSDKQTGESIRKIDKRKSARKPGWRKAKTSGEWYYENRRNRSDKNKKTRL